MPHRWINTESFRVVDILIACQAAINRLTQQGQDAVLLVLAKSRILHAHGARLGQMQRLIKFPIHQQPSVGGDLASQELHLQSTVEIDPQAPVLAVTHWVSLSEWRDLMKDSVFQGSGANGVPHVTFSSGKCGPSPVSYASAYRGVAAAKRV
jgi:hypothetical protein